MMKAGSGVGCGCVGVGQALGVDGGLARVGGLA